MHIENENRPIRHALRRLRMKLISIEAAIAACLIMFFGCTWGISLMIPYNLWVFYSCASAFSAGMCFYLIFFLIKSLKDK